VINLVEAICNKLTLKIRNAMPEVDDERAEIINYGLQLIIGEAPKFLILLIIACLFGVPVLSILALLFILPYRIVSGGVHLKTHIGCIIATSIFYIGNAYISKTLILEQDIKLALILFIWIFSIVMIKLYAPADTEAVPILRQKERRIKKIISYIIMTINLIIAILIKNSIISNLLIFGTLLQSIAISRFMFKITNNKYGHEEYYKNNVQV